MQYRIGPQNAISYRSPKCNIGPQYRLFLETDRDTDSQQNIGQNRVMTNDYPISFIFLCYCNGKFFRHIVLGIVLGIVSGIVSYRVLYWVSYRVSYRIVLLNDPIPGWPICITQVW